MKTAFDCIGGIRPAVDSDFKPLTDEEISTVEHLIGKPLPATYRTFLETLGACGFEEYIEFVPSEQLPDVFETGTGNVSVLYGSNRSSGYGLDERIQYFASRIPSGLVPIGDNGMGDQICILLLESDFGAVYYWDMESEPLTDEEYIEDFGVSMPDSEKWSNVYRIADSFDDFVARLRVSND